MSDAPLSGGFAAGTPILTETGYRPIEEIKAGEQVASAEGRLRAVVSVSEAEAPCVRLVTEIRPPVTLAAENVLYAAAPRRDRAIASKTYGKDIYGLCSRIPARDCAGRRALLAHGFSWWLPLPDMAYDETGLLRLAGWAAGTGLSLDGEAVALEIPRSQLSAFRAVFAPWVRASDTIGGISREWLIEAPAAFLKANFANGGFPAWLLALTEAKRALFLWGVFAANGESRPSARVWRGVGLSAGCGLCGLLPTAALAPQTGWAAKAAYIARESGGEGHCAKNANGDWLTPIRAAMPSGPRKVYQIGLAEGHTCLISGGLVAACG